MATPDQKLADVEKTSSHSTSLVANEAYVDPKGEDTLHRGLNARQVRLPSLACSARVLTLAPDFHDFPWGCCWNRSHHRLRNSARPVSLPSRSISFAPVQTLLRQRGPPRSPPWVQLCRVCLLPCHGFSRGNVCLHSTQTWLRRLCYPFRRPRRRIRPRIQLPHEVSDRHPQQH